MSGNYSQDDDSEQLEEEKSIIDYVCYKCQSNTDPYRVLSYCIVLQEKRIAVEREKLREKRK